MRSTCRRTLRPLASVSVTVSNQREAGSPACLAVNVVSWYFTTCA